MALREIFFCGDPALRRKAQRIANITGDIVQLMQDMEQTMVEAPGLGLAAPQVGVPVRAIVVRPGDEEDDDVLCLLNPRIIQRDGDQEGTEGCLSFPTLQGIVLRDGSVVVEGLDLQGDRVCVEAEGMFARCIQHEIDHLDGILFPDRVEEDTLGWMVPDEDEESGYRIDPTTIDEVVARFERLRQHREGRSEQ